ncbi:MAG: hypothetical protein JKX94_12220 [Sneathiella sp.]|nr:hypothetical protein [Sneathiella sp.]
MADLQIKFLLVLTCIGTLFIYSSVKADPRLWLPEGSQTGVAGAPPTEFLIEGQALEGQSLLGKLLFNSPSLLGEKAVRIGLSCNSCHPNGHVNTSFYISGLSGDPGTIDLSNSFWRKGTEDGKFNPIPIPSLRNISKTAPYGSQISLPSLPAFTRHVIVDEFDGPPPSAQTMKALISYMNLLAKETSMDMSRQEKTIPLRRVFELLLPALQSQDTKQLDSRIFLIKEELGRRVTPENRTRLEKKILQIKNIQENVVTDPEAAKAAYDILVYRAALN